MNWGSAQWTPALVPPKAASGRVSRGIAGPNGDAQLYER